MLDWRDKLCGSLVEKEAAEEETPSLQKILASNEILTCGGGFFPLRNNGANLKTLANTSFILPTKKYSILVFKEDGNAVIYSEEEDVIQAESSDSLKK